MSYEHFDRLMTIYSRDKSKNIREWSIEIGFNNPQDAAYRVYSGIQGGAIVTSEWKKATPKNVGRSNETVAYVQAQTQAAAEYKKRLDKGYFKTIEEVDNSKPFEPMLAKEYKGDIDFDNTWVFVQPKLDGIRCIAKADGLWTRTGKKIESCLHIERALAPLFERDKTLILDGELYNHQFKDNFNEITSIVRKQKLSDDDTAKSAAYMQYHVYDVVHKNYEYFTERTEFLHQLVHLVSHPCVKYVDTLSVSSEEELDVEYANFIEQGFEGMMIRNNEPYENKRSKNLLKRKDFLTDEFKVVSIEEGEGNWAGYAKRFQIELPNGDVCGAGVRGNQQTLKDLWGSAMPDWCTVRYFTPTPDGVPRFPVVVDWGYKERND